MALCHYLSSRSSFICSLIYGASSPCQPRQERGQLHKHFTDKDGQLFTDEAKVLLAADTMWVWMWRVALHEIERERERLCVCDRVFVRKREERRGMMKRGPNVQPLLLWTPAGLSAGTHLSDALNATPTLGCATRTHAAKYRMEGIRKSLFLSLSSQPLTPLSPFTLHLPPPAPLLCHSSPAFYSLCSLSSVGYKRWIHRFCLSRSKIYAQVRLQYSTDRGAVKCSLNVNARLPDVLSCLQCPIFRVSQLVLNKV